MIHQPIIPAGEHYGLAFDRPGHLDTGSFASGAAFKTVWHTTQGGTFQSAHDTLIAKGAEPHFLLDCALRRVHQFISLDRYARALEHPPSTPETNRAGAIQVEILGYAADSHAWPSSWYRDIAALALIIEHRKGVRRISTWPFTADGAHRVDPEHWLVAHGHFGHEHAPSQPGGHWDPGVLNIAKVFAQMASLDLRG